MKHMVALSTALLLWAPVARADEALAAAMKAYDAAWDAAPLEIVKSLAVTGQPGGFGMYSERAPGPYKPSEDVLIYAEPVAYGFRDNGDGTNTIGFTLDLNIAKPDGSVVYDQANWQHVEVTTRERNHEFFLTIDLSFASAPPPPGDYVLTFTVHDMNSAESAPVTLPITLAD